MKKIKGEIRTLKKLFKSLATLFAVVLLVSSFANTSVSAAEQNRKCVPKKIMWGKTELKNGQLGKVTILKETKLYSLKDNKLAAGKVLPAKGEYRVYSFKKAAGAELYGVGGGSYVKKDSLNKYETPSKRKLAELKAAACVENEGGFLWKAEKNGNTVYMLGSIHIGIEEYYPLNSKIMNAFNKSQNLVVEANILNVDPYEIQQFIMEKGVYTDATTIEDHITKELYTKLGAAFDEYGMDINKLKQFKPWYMNMLLEGLVPMDPKYNPELGIDYQLLSNAGKKKIIELEGMEFQLNMMAGFSDKVQIKLLEDFLKTERNGNEIEPLIKAWQYSDDAAIEKLVFDIPDNSPEYKEYMTEMFDKRNMGMANKIEQYLKAGNKQTYFVVVGAGHYFGDMSVIKLLERKGYKIEKIQ